MPQHYQKELHQFFSWCPDYICMNYHIRKCAQTMWTVPQHCQQVSTSCLLFFFLSFPDFLLIFLLITILGNVHTICRWCTNIVDNDLHLSLHFFPIFPDFLSIFTLITILGNVHRPCTQYLNIINKYTSCLTSFSWFLLICHYLCIDYHIRKYTQTT